MGSPQNQVIPKGHGSPFALYGSVVAAGSVDLTSGPVCAHQLTPEVPGLFLLRFPLPPNTYPEGFPPDLPWGSLGLAGMATIDLLAASLDLTQPKLCGQWKSPAAHRVDHGITDIVPIRLATCDA